MNVSVHLYLPNSLSVPYFSRQCQEPTNWLVRSLEVIEDALECERHALVSHLASAREKPGCRGAGKAEELEGGRRLLSGAVHSI